MIGISNESDFEKHIRQDILNNLVSNNPNYKIFDFKKAVDILIARNNTNPALFFLEIKYHKINHGRLGFGHSKGGGFQPEVLKTNIDYFETNLRWILGHESSDKYWFVDNSILRQYLNGNAVEEKYNGIKLKFFTEVEGYSIDELTSILSEWLGLNGCSKIQ
ncbi:hypothetical protein [Flavobacterium sp. NRK1]|uniref:hypothetical protein n=1 Tax=Flavobacterium sp. NRK1 TaxID=2954929 RepID=UPI0020927D06|nr:hypothetical protein [Flavobacterium sp. NRK1]MCO6147382.1 hypothetical protein [Flavobacterium sp. NRK1]